MSDAERITLTTDATGKLVSETERADFHPTMPADLSPPPIGMPDPQDEDIVAIGRDAGVWVPASIEGMEKARLVERNRLLEGALREMRAVIDIVLERR